MKSIYKILILTIVSLNFCLLFGKQNLLMSEFEQKFKNFKHYNDRHEAVLDLLYNYPEADTSFVLLYLKETLQIASINNKQNKLFDLYLAFSNLYLRYKNYKAVDYYARLALKYKDFSQDKKLLLNNYENLGISTFNLNIYDESLEWYKLALSVVQEMKNEKDIADIYSKFSVIYNLQDNIMKAIEYSEKSLEVRLKFDNNLNEIFLNFSNLGTYNIRISNYPKALQYFIESLQYAEKLEDNKALGTAYLNIGTVYHYLRDNEKALEFYLESLNYIDENEPLVLSKVYNNIALSYKKKKDTQKTIEYHKKSLAINIKHNHIRNMATSFVNIGSIYSDIGEYDLALSYFLQALPIYEDLKSDFGLCSVYNNLGAVYMRNNQLDLALEHALKANKLAIKLKSKSNIITNYAVIVKIYELMNDYKNAYDNMLIYSAYRDSVFSENNMRQINEMQVKFDTEKKEKENELLKKDSEIRNLELSRLRLQWLSLLIIIIFLAIFVIIALILFYKQKYANTNLTKAKKLIELEKNKSEELLLNILPYNIAQEIKTTGVSQPQAYEEVTVFYSDLVDFTAICSKLNPIEVIKELNELFSEFDEIFKKYNCEKIKTIGDAYIAVSGINSKQTNHAEDIMNSAIEILTFLYKKTLEKNIKWEIRIGIHTGKIVGGVIGQSKFVYDIFGDTINIAGRMEQICQPMHINLSETTYNLIQGQFELDSHESINIKGKGLMKVYTFVQPKSNLE